jgi:DNA-binding NarL/FixJ family response regulator
MNSPTQPQLSTFFATVTGRSTSGSPRHVLLVDDEPVFQVLIQDAVGQLGAAWQLSTFGNGQDCLDFLDQTILPLSLALVDLGLPDMSGIEVIRHIRSKHPQTPVLVMSIFSDQAHVIEAIKAGARGYLLKDDSALAIADSIRRIEAGEYPISPSLARYLFALAAPSPVENKGSQAISLSPKELELLQLLAKGYPYKKAARLMEVSISTIQTHVQRMYQKLESNSKLEAVSKARQQGLIP